LFIMPSPPLALTVCKVTQSADRSVPDRQRCDHDHIAVKRLTTAQSLPHCTIVTAASTSARSSSVPWLRRRCTMTVRIWPPQFEQLHESPKIRRGRSCLGHR
jgi:hypothetical protein